MKVGWDSSHQEFIISDHYYFSILKRESRKRGVTIEDCDDLERIFEYDVFVFNYPEEDFSRDDIKIIENYLKRGGKIIFAGYWINEDGVNDVINKVTKRWGCIIRDDFVYDDINNFNDDNLFIVSKRIRENIKKEYDIYKVLMPCTSSLEINGWQPLILAERTARSSKYDEKNLTLMAEKIIFNGKVIVSGSCVFWDNYSIEKYNNLELSLYLFTK